MAFQQQPNRPSVQRAARSAVGSQGLSRRSARSTYDQEPEEAQTWVLFSPPTDVTTTSYLTEDEHDQSLETPGRSRVSDLGSLNTVARTGSVAAAAQNDEAQSSALSAAVDESQDDAELDSLDGHLPGFRSFPRSSFMMPVLPAHDGLGSFHLDQPTLGQDAQDHIFQFERFNPRRVRRRLNSFDEAQFELEQAQVQEAEKRQRIEAWRLEHSRIILEEVQREARRTRMLQQKRVVTQKPVPKAEEATDSEDMTWHEEDPDTHPEDKEDSEGLITRITRKVLRDILGIDEKILSVVLGGDLLSDEELSRTPRPSEHGHDEPTAETEESWHMRIIETVSRELGLLVNHLSKHPGAFSTYSHVHQVPLPYAGLPAIPETADGRTSASGRAAADKHGESVFPEFRPTMRHIPRAADRPSQRSNAQDILLHDVSMADTFTQEEWEQEIDIKLVFRYLVSRFTSQPEPTLSPELTTRPVPAKPQDAAAKAARVRQHHPLTSRTRPNERRAFKATAPSSPVAMRHHSSCASQSTRRSARRSSVSSRHYWDIGGSIGTGSMIATAPNAPMGSWGEV
ncbi:hypothetical protein CI102_4536 [Trichoderma harzianum]|uniref:Uncharacterized protein n=1 Tax=Trichoderma harzianum CBS 226.95 TaxID=983964 RepID=A0A2T4ACX9_TRIHA|nr:hypothetical protein M431DRAFT_85866 [Trichoderma harzianum CBS 226.95]PKK52301.1 hypothetical protein CI102_4536 [Trichoderma harzianum]PTB54788.1 hypothetical protein M431DRAFT_85866 [Trichoderma harzianum CBS 226.95]